MLTCICVYETCNQEILHQLKSSLSGQICVSIKSSHILFTGITGHGWMPTSIESTLYFNVAIGGENVNG